MEISRKLYNSLQELDLRVTDSYSGRFMFGKECFGVIVSQLASALYDVTEALREIVATEQDDQDLFEEASGVLEGEELIKFRTDNMGLDYIIYFPHITVEKEVE